MEIDRSLISQTIIAKEYARLVYRRTRPELEPYEYNEEIDKQTADKVKAEGFELASSLYFALPIAEFKRTLDDFSADHVAPIVDHKYPEA